MGIRVVFDYKKHGIVVLHRVKIWSMLLIVIICGVYHLEAFLDAGDVGTLPIYHVNKIIDNNGKKGHSDKDGDQSTALRLLVLILIEVHFSQYSWPKLVQTPQFTLKAAFTFWHLLILIFQLFSYNNAKIIKK